MQQNGYSELQELNNIPAETNATQNNQATDTHALLVMIEGV